MSANGHTDCRSSELVVTTYHLNLGALTSGGSDKYWLLNNF